MGLSSPTSPTTVFMKQNGGSAVDAVEKAVSILEEHDHFNAGRGSCLNEIDEVECDAMIMDGHNLKTGIKAQIETSLYRVDKSPNFTPGCC